MLPSIPQTHDQIINWGGLRHLEEEVQVVVTGNGYNALSLLQC